MRLRSERASALVLALLMLVVAQGLVLAVTTRAMLASRAAVRLQQRAVALNAAEAGLAECVQVLLRDNAAYDEEGEIGQASWTVDADEEVRQPFVSIVTFDATATFRDQARRIRLRLAVRRDRLEEISELHVLDWTLP